MAVPDISQTSNEINSKISAVKTGADVLKSKKKLEKDAENSLSKTSSNISSQLSKIAEKQKRFQREAPTSMDQLTKMIGQVNGNGPETVKYLRKKLLEAVTKIEPQVQGILKEQSIKAIGCSQEQTYNGIKAADLKLTPLSQLPQSQGIYIPVSSVDFFSNLKNSPESSIGKVYYEKLEPSGDSKFKPYGGDVPFPMNKQLYGLLQSGGTSFSQLVGKNYTGKSGQNLFDVQYAKTNSFGVTGDYYRVVLIDREGTNGNKVEEFISDYYSTIQLTDPVDIGAQLVNIISGAMDTKSQIGFGELENKSKFYLIAQRILGLCFDSRKEIDVSGVSKIAELDGVDDSFFELNEIDLRAIDIRISNVQNGVVEFENCGNVKLPVDYEVLVDELINFRNTISGQTEEQRVATLEKIIDTISENPDWKALIPSSLDANIAINQNIIQQMPLAVAASVLTPKVLLPLYTILSVVESGATYTYNQAITSGNTVITSANSITTSATTASSDASNVVTSGTEFLKKFKTFCIEVISRINEVFLRVLFDILKRDIVNLLSIIITDIGLSKKIKNYDIILKLVNIAFSVGLIVSEAVRDYRECKNLLDDILNLLNLINSVTGIGDSIPLPLLLLSRFLPGTSPERATINTIEILQKLGIPTGTLPDGSPNLMLLYNLATNQGADKEKLNEKTEGVVIVPPMTGGVLRVFGKSK